MTQAPTQSAVVQYNPNAAIGNPVSLKRLLETQKASLLSILPKHVTPERLLKTMLVAVNRVPALLECTQASVLETITRAGELGLDLSGTLGEAYPVPYGKQCQLIIGYRGLAKLARQSGEVATISSDVVCRHDRFTFRKGGNAICEWEPPMDGERGEVIGAFAHVQFRDGTQQFDYMTVAEINAIRNRSRSGKSGPWVTDWNEMAKKTVFRRLAKWLPLSAEKFVQALEHDQRIAELDIEPVDQSPKGSAGVLAKLKGEAATLPQDGPDTEGSPEGGPTPQNAADGQEPGNPPTVEGLDSLRSRYYSHNPRLKKETDDQMEARFVAWVAKTAQMAVEGAEGIDGEMVARCHTAIDEIEGA